jgi:hypothetical protein
MPTIIPSEFFPDFMKLYGIFGVDRLCAKRIYNTKGTVLFSELVVQLRVRACVYVCVRGVAGRDGEFFLVPVHVHIIRRTCLYHFLLLSN